MIEPTNKGIEPGATWYDLTPEQVKSCAQQLSSISYHAGQLGFMGDITESDELSKRMDTFRAWAIEYEIRWQALDSSSAERMDFWTDVRVWTTVRIATYRLEGR